MKFVVAVFTVLACQLAFLAIATAQETTADPLTTEAATTATAAETTAAATTAAAGATTADAGATTADAGATTAAAGATTADAGATTAAAGATTAAAGATTAAAGATTAAAGATTAAAGATTAAAGATTAAAGATTAAAGATTKAGATTAAAGSTTTTKKSGPPKRTTTPRPPNCASGNFATMPKCCASAAAPLVNAEKGDKTCKINAGAVKIFNSYVLNKQQVAKTNNSIDFAGSKTPKALGKDACFVNCYLTANGAIDASGAIKSAELSKLLAKNQAGEYATKVPALVAECEKSVKDPSKQCAKTVELFNTCSSLVTGLAAPMKAASVEVAPHAAAASANKKVQSIKKN